MRKKIKRQDNGNPLQYSWWENSMDRHFSGKPFTTREIHCSAMGAIPIHTFTSFKKDKEDTGEMSKREVSKLALTDALKFKYNYFL